MKHFVQATSPIRKKSKEALVTGSGDTPPDPSLSDEFKLHQLTDTKLILYVYHITD